MIYVVDLEKLEERYTVQWASWVPQGLKANDLDFKIISGTPLTTSIEKGSVLDVYGTNHYKASQMQTLMKMLRANEIKDEDTIFFCDLWFPGIEALQYVRNVTGKKFKIQGVLHAGSWDEHDFTFLTGMDNWARSIERGWLEIYDKVFLGSEFHKQLILEAFPDVPENKFAVTGLPFRWTDVYRPKNPIFFSKEKIVVFPHRLDSEKRPDLFDEMRGVLEPLFPEWSFLKTKEETKTKEQYYHLLNRAAISISYAEQETFGYAMLESVANDCLAIVPNALSYSTMPMYTGMKFSSFEESIECVTQAIIMFNENSENYRQCVRNTKLGLSELSPESVFSKMKNAGLR